MEQTKVRIRARSKKKDSGTRKSRYSVGRRKKDVSLLLISLPAVVKLIIFSYLPMSGLILAFKFYKPFDGMWGSPWVGFANFEMLFKSQQFLTIVTNAIGLNLLFIVTGTAVSLFLALFLYEVTQKWFVKTTQTILFFPYFISWPIVGAILLSLLDDVGLITQFVEGITGSSYDFYKEPAAWPLILVIANIWKTAGMNAIIYYATLMGVDKEIYEAADIDGASRYKKMLHISIPSLKMMIAVSIIMSSANILKVDFSMIFYLTQDSSFLRDTTDVIETYMYRAMRINNNYEVSTAVGLVQGVVGLILSFFANKISNKLSGTGLV